MDIFGIRWKADMILKITIIFLLIVTTINSSHAQDNETSISENFELNYTLYSTKIEFETEYENYTLEGAKCEEKSALSKTSFPFDCIYLEPCTTYRVTANVRYLPNNNIFDVSCDLRTEYEEPETSVNSVLPYHDSIFISWNSSNRNCISDIKIRAFIDNNLLEFNNMNGEDFTIENLEPCRTCHLFLIMTDINKVVLANLSEDTETCYQEPGPVQSVIFDVNASTVVIQWREPEYATCVDFYYIMYTVKECFDIDPEICLWTPKNISVSDPRELTINDLEGCQNYVVQFNVNGDQFNSSSNHEFSMPMLEPGPVMGLNASYKTSTNLTITWDPPKQNSLCVEYYAVNISSENELFYTTETVFSFQDLIPCAQYEISVAAVAESNVTGPWKEIHALMDYDNPSRIINEVIDATPDTLNVTWEAPLFASLCISHYRIAVWYMKTANNPEHVFDDDVKMMSVSIPNLISCETYTIQIIAVTSSKDAQEGAPAHFDATTEPRVLERASVPDIKVLSSTSIRLLSQNTDNKNHCENLYARFSCEVPDEDADVAIKYAETIFKFKDDGLHFSNTIEPLSPFTVYRCSVAIYNVAGWSNPSTALVTTFPDYPDIPTAIVARGISSNSLRIQWGQPKNLNGKLNIYKLHIQTVGAKYRIPSYCTDIRFQELTQPVEASKPEFTYDDALPYVVYSVQVAAVNEVGVGDFSDPVFVTTMPSKSIPVTNFSVEAIQGPELSETYHANVTLDWPLPCRANGDVVAFEGAFMGIRNNSDDDYFTWTLPVNSTYLSENDYFKFLSDKLKPEYNYTVSISVVIEYGDISDKTTLEFNSPSGIPPKPNISNNGDVNVFAARNPTQSAYVRFAADILNSDMGRILYISLLVSEKDCQTEPTPEFALIQSETEWPKVSTWGEVISSKCIKQYQATPKRWSPKPVLPRDGSHKPIIEYTVGADDDCKRNNEYCNGPLKPGANYAVIVRLFTSSGYSDTSSMYFRTDSEVKIHFVLLLIVSCLLIAFFLGFLYLWVTKKIVWHGEPFHGFEEQTGDISSKNFLEFYGEIAKSEKVHREFKELTAISNDLNLSNVASTSNETKNRYSNIFPYDKNRVILDCDSEGSDYINASFINGYKRRKEYIATQGPKPESFVDFWKMILQYDVRVIVMVTQFKEGDTVKCHQYFPYLNKELHFGHNISVRCKKEMHYENFEKRELEIEHFGDCINRSIVHYYFRKWPDHDCPTDVTHLIDFVRKVKSEKIPSHSPIAVHCSAGVGRTGTFIGLDIMKQRLKNENRINIYDTVKELRFQRMKMVQTIQQYQFLYNCAYYMVKKKHSALHKKLEQKKDERPTTKINGFKPTSNGNGIVHAESIM